MKLRPFLAALPFFLLAGTVIGQSIVTEAQRSASSERWEKEISALEARDRSETHGPDSILFVGSSSIRRWNDIGEGMAPYRPIQRGFGGSNWTDVVVFADRLLSPHSPRAFVFFVGNDITGRENDRSPDEVVALFSEVLEVIRTKHPTTPVFYVAVTPSGARFSAWPRIKAGNRAVQAFCEATPNTYFIASESAFLDAGGKPRDELFVEDRLHLNADGYVRWAAIIKSHLDGVLGGALIEP